MSIALDELVAVGDRGDDLVGGRGTDRGDRVVVGRLRERDDELVVLEVDRQREPAGARVSAVISVGRVLVDRRLEEVDERHAELVGERGGEVLAPDETELEQHRRQRLLRALGFFDRVLEAVARQHVTIDERLSEATNLVDEHGCRSPRCAGS